MLTNCEAFQPQVYPMMNLALPLNQSEAFQRTCDKVGLPVERITNELGTCLVQSRKLPVLGQFHLLSRGPILEDPAKLPEFVNQVRGRLSGAMVVNAGDGAPDIGGLKIAQGAKLAIVDLVNADEMRTRLHQKWRNQLKKAERAGLTIIDQPLSAMPHSWFLRAEAAQQKARRYKSYPTGFLLAYATANKGQARLYSAMMNGEPIAGILVLKHGRMATYQAGVTTPEGRRHCAHNLLLWRAMSDLQRKRFIQLDLGRADLSEGLRRFKLGTGARVEQLAGSFLSHSWLGRRHVPPVEDAVDLRHAA